MIYYLDKDPVKCAQAYCDGHVKQVPIYICQLLSLYVCQSQTSKTNLKGLYKIYGIQESHTKLCRWLGDHKQNYTWMVRLFQELLKEHELRFNKKHVVSGMLPLLQSITVDLKNGDNTRQLVFPVLIPDKYFVDDNMKPVNILSHKFSTVNSNRNYYNKIIVGNYSFTKRQRVS